MPKTLYICYFGVREPLVQTQVIPYLREILKDGVEVSLLTFEPEFRKKWTAVEVEKQRAELLGIGIKWHVLGYHKRPSVPATAWDILAGTWMVRKLLKREKFDILHGRVHIPTLMGALARKLSSHKPKLLFDIRGFFPEEYTDAGRWPEGGWLYRTVKRVEKWLLDESDGYVVLTENARRILFPESGERKVGSPARIFDRSNVDGKPLEVIPCCVDLDRRFEFDRNELRTRIRRELSIDGRFVMVHVGALGGLYLTEQIADLIAATRKFEPLTFAIFLTQSDPALIEPLLRNRGLGASDYFIAKVAPIDVPAYLCAADAGISFVKAGYATRSRSPTKIPEYLACGLPLIANGGVGDVDELISRHQIGVLVDGFASEDYIRPIGELRVMNVTAESCRDVAEKEFELKSIGGPRYRRLYERLLSGTATKS